MYPSPGLDMFQGHRLLTGIRDYLPEHLAAVLSPAVVLV